MPVVELGEVRVNYQISGSGPETLVLVNGVGDDLEAWAPQMDDFLAAGLRVLRFDNRGSGGSSQPPGPYSTAQMAADLKLLTSALHLPPFHLAGVSLGGCVVQEYALSHPSDLLSAVLANTYCSADGFAAAAFGVWGLVARSAGMQVMMRQMAPWIFSPDFYRSRPERIAELVVESEATPQPVDCFLAQMAALLDHDCEARIGELGTPSLVIAASDDIVIRSPLSRHLFNALPDASWSEVGGGHAAFWENPAEWNAAVVSFVQAHSSSEQIRSSK